MLFLINDQVFDIADPAATADKQGHLLSPTPALLIKPVEVVEIGRELFFQAEGERPRRDLLIALAALLADKTDANAALFVRPEKAKSRSDVMVRFVDAPITTLAYLQKLQKGDIAPASVVNNAVWFHAA